MLLAVAVHRLVLPSLQWDPLPLQASPSLRQVQTLQGQGEGKQQYSLAAGSAAAAATAAVVAAAATAAVVAAAATAAVVAATVVGQAPLAGPSSLPVTWADPAAAALPASAPAGRPPRTGRAAWAGTGELTRGLPVGQAHMRARAALAAQQQRRGWSRWRAGEHHGGYHRTLGRCSWGRTG